MSLPNVSDGNPLDSWERGYSSVGEAIADLHPVGPGFRSWMLELAARSGTCPPDILSQISAVGADGPERLFDPDSLGAPSQAGV